MFSHVLMALSSICLFYFSESVWWDELKLLTSGDHDWLKAYTCAHYLTIRGDAVWQLRAIFFLLAFQKSPFQASVHSTDFSLIIYFDIAFVCITSKTQTLTNTHNGELMWWLNILKWIRSVFCQCMDGESLWINAAFFFLCLGFYDVMESR